MLLHRLHQLQQLTLSEWWILLISMVMLPLVALGIHWKGYQWTRDGLSRFVSTKPGMAWSDEDKLDHAREVSRMVSIAEPAAPAPAGAFGFKGQIG